MEILMPASLIATVFFFLWVAVYPTELKECLLFQAGRKPEDIVMGILTWVFLAGMVNFMMWIVTKINT